MVEALALINFLRSFAALLFLGNVDKTYYLSWISFSSQSAGLLPAVNYLGMPVFILSSIPCRIVNPAWQSSTNVVLGTVLVVYNGME